MKQIQVTLVYLVDDSRDLHLEENRMYNALIDSPKLQHSEFSKRDFSNLQVSAKEFTS